MVCDLAQRLSDEKPGKMGSVGRGGDVESFVESVRYVTVGRKATGNRQQAASDRQEVSDAGQWHSRGR